MTGGRRPVPADRVRVPPPPGRPGYRRRRLLGAARLPPPLLTWIGDTPPLMVRPSGLVPAAVPAGQLEATFALGDDG